MGGFEEWKDILINDLCKFGPEDLSQTMKDRIAANAPMRSQQERVTPRYLKPEEYPIKRDTKRRPRVNRPRGEAFTRNAVRAIFQTPEQAEAAWKGMPTMPRTPGGQEVRWNGIDKRGHTNSGRYV
jgi:hypothetical protein